MGKPYLVKIYEIISDTPDIDLCKLRELPSFPSEYIMDNVLFYGEYEVIGHLPLEDDEIGFPISYGRSISALNNDTVYLQYGKIYRECSIFDYDKHINVQSEDGNIHYNFFRYEHIGFYLYRSICKLKGDKFKEPVDLRRTEYIETKNEIFKQFGLDPNKSYSDNYKLLYSK